MDLDIVSDGRNAVVPSCNVSNQRTGHTRQDTHTSTARFQNRLSSKLIAWLMRLTALMLGLASRTAAALLTPRGGSFALASTHLFSHRVAAATAGATCALKMSSGAAATAATAGVCCEVIPVPVLNDNYSYLIIDRATNQV
jgi:hypothetical protein